MPTDSQACACSLSRRSPYCPLSKYALTCASARRAVFSHCPAWLIATRKIQLGPEAKQGNKPRAEKEAGLGETKQRNKPRAEKEAGLGETKQGNKPQKKRTIITNNEKKEKRGSPWL